MCSCLGQIPLDDVDKQSSSSGVTWMPTSTGLDAFFISMGEGEGGLSTAFSKQRLPLHCFRLCSIKIRMSPNGKFIWHCPQVRRSWSPSGAPSGPWSGSSSVRMASRGSAVIEETKAPRLECQCGEKRGRHTFSPTPSHHIAEGSSRLLHITPRKPECAACIRPCRLSTKRHRDQPGQLSNISTKLTCLTP